MDSSFTGLIEKADRVNNFIKRTRDVYGFNDPIVLDCCDGDHASPDTAESSGDGDIPQVINVFH